MILQEVNHQEQFLHQEVLTLVVEEALVADQWVVEDHLAAVAVVVDEDKKQIKKPVCFYQAGF
jgi:hypothetical protein